MTMIDCDANQACDKLVTCLRDSGLNFLSQETPFSVFITIRKSFYREGKQKFPVTENHKNLKTENDTLKNALEDNDLELKTSRDENVALQKRLEKAEKEMLLHFKNVKISDEKFKDEISVLKSELKKIRISSHP